MNQMGCKKKYYIRELMPKDIDYWIKESNNNLYSLNSLLSAPLRYKNEDINSKWYYFFSKNYGESIRISIVNEADNVCAMVSMTNIDFFARKAELCYFPLNDKEIYQYKNYVEIILDVLSKKLSISEIKYSGDAQKLFGIYASSINISFVLPSYNCILNELPDYCITNILSKEEKQYLLSFFDGDMFFPISKRTDYEEVKEKISSAAEMLLAYNENLLGFLALYANNITQKEAYISVIAIGGNYHRKGIGKRLLEKAIQIANNRGMKTIALEVNKNNQTAISFYKMCGFHISKMNSNSLSMIQKL